MADGRWLRISRSPTRDDGFIVVCSDISRSKKQEASLRETNLLLDAALENMSQGLCLYDAQNRLEVFNQRYLEIFRLPPDQIKPGITSGRFWSSASRTAIIRTRPSDQLWTEPTKLHEPATPSAAFL